ncbi:transposase [Streptomyces sp. NBC_00490]
MTSSQQREPYLSDLSDARWALMELTLTAWRAERQKTSLNLGGNVTDLREVMNAILFLNRTGVPWRYLPHDFPAAHHRVRLLQCLDRGRHHRETRPPPAPDGP